MNMGARGWWEQARRVSELGRPTVRFERRMVFTVWG